MTTAARVKTHGWGLRLVFRGRTLAELGRRDGTSLTAGERPDCDLVIPGLGERVVLTDGPTLTIPPGVEGEIHAGEALRPAAELTGERLTLAPGDRAALRVAAHPEIEITLTRTELERLPWSARLHGRELARQLVTGAGLVALLAVLWRVERVENTLKLRGDPDALDDSPLLRAMFLVPEIEPPEVRRARELFAPRLLPPPPPPPAPELPASPGEEILDTAPAPLPMLLEAKEEVPGPEPELVAPTEYRAEIRSKKERRGKRGRGVRGEEVFAVLSASNDAVLGSLIGSKDFEGGFGLIGEGGGGVGEGVFGGVEGGVEGGVLGGVEGGVVGGVPGGVVGGVLGGTYTPPEPQQKPTSSEGAIAHVGPNSHQADGALATRGERDGLAAVVEAASCDDPTVSRKQQIDVVFAVDVSTTMNFMLGKIEQEIAAVDATVRAQGLDARYGLVVFVDDVEVANGGRAYADLAALQRDLTSWQAFTASNRQIKSTGSNLDWPENSLDALHAAATEFAWRPAGATLRAIVHATDDDFGEAPAVHSGQPVRHTYRETLAALKAAEVRVFSFAAKIGGQCECLDVKAGLFAPYRGQKAIPAATGGAVFDIDEVASGGLDFGRALSGALQTAVCTHYPLSPFATSAKK